MGKVTKIMLGLNILAGIAGIVFGMGVKGDLKSATEEKQAAVAKAAEATGSTSKLQSDNQKLTSDIQIAQGQIAKATNDLVVAQQALSSVQGGQGQMVTDLQAAQAARATLQSELAIAQQVLTDKAKELQTAIADHEATNAKLSKALTDANRTHAEKSIELGKAINALKPFLSTGLTPEQIKELQQKRPVEIAAPRFIAPKPIKPGKLSKPIQQSIQTP